MGILGLRKLIQDNAPGAIKKVPVNDLAGMKIGVDASIGIYELFYTGAKYNIIGSTGLPINHIQGTFHRIVSYLRAGIIPVYIFDGKPPEIKAGVIAARSEMKINGKGIKVPQYIFTDVMRLLQLMKIPYVQAPSEAEAQAAVMCAAGVLSAVATSDTDSLTFGARQQLIGLDGQAKFVTAVSRDNILTGLGLTSAQFIDLCILLGCDYVTAGLPGVGPKRSLAFIRKYGSIEAIIAGEKLIVPAGFTYKEARAEFERPSTMQTDGDYTKPVYTEDDIEAIDKFLTNSGLSSSRYKKGLASLR